MKSRTAIFLFILTSGILLCSSYNSLYSDFREFRSTRQSEEILLLIEKLTGMEKLNDDAEMLCLLANCYREYAYWGCQSKSEKLKYSKLAKKYADDAIKTSPDYGMAYYVAGVATGLIMDSGGITKGIKYIDDFDRYIKKAMYLLPEYCFPFYAMARKYKEAPWPYGSAKKAETLLKKAISLNPEYLFSHMDLGLLYDKQGKDYEAKLCFEKLLLLSGDPDFKVENEIAKETAFKWLLSNGFNPSCVNKP